MALFCSLIANFVQYESSGGSFVLALCAMANCGYCIFYAISALKEDK